MSRKRFILSTSFIICSLLLVGLSAMSLKNTPIPTPALTVVVLDPYDNDLLRDYGHYRNSVISNDLNTLKALATTSSGYLRYRTALTLAYHPDVPANEQLEYFKQVLALRIDDPLDYVAYQQLLIDVAQTAEAAGQPETAITYYRDALPNAQAIKALKRLESNPYVLANVFLQSRQYQNALDALGSLSAPSIEAPAYRGLGAYEDALEAYNAWLREEPTSETALLGKAWVLFYLGENAQADAIFQQFSSASALYGRALIANRLGDVTSAVALLQQTGDAEDLWLATSLLERDDRYDEALSIYLQLARGNSSYADDSAYRAYVLAQRLNEPDVAVMAENLLPENSFFGLKVGKPLSVARAASQTDAPLTLPVIALANALAQVDDKEAAIGELLFALRDASDEQSIIALAEQLQVLGEYRQSQRAASALLSAGSDDVRIWKLAYPQAYPLDVAHQALQNQVEPELVWAIMRQESAFFPYARSRSNAQGLMQVIPSTWEWLAELQKEPPADPYNPADNIRYGTFYLRWLLNYLGNDIELVIPSYNRGQGYIKRLYESSVVNQNKDELYREIDAFETREYLQRVMMNYEIYKTLYRN